MALRQVEVLKRTFSTTESRITVDVEYVGRFHQWGAQSSMCGDNDAGVMDTYAIVEKENGEIDLVLPELIRFVTVP